MQEAILLSARWQRTAEIVHQVAFGDDHSHELEVMSWLSVSVLMREKIADHVQVNPEKRASDPLEDKHAPSFGEVELGAMKRGDLARAQDEAFRMVERALWPLEAVTSGSPTRQKTEELQGDARLQKREGNPLLLVLDKKSGGVSPELLKWLNNDFHVGYVIITTSNGEFELREGEWKATLVKLCHILQPFAQ